jgi:hypothetical protein
MTIRALIYSALLVTVVLLSAVRHRDPFTRYLSAVSIVLIPFAAFAWMAPYVVEEDPLCGFSGRAVLPAMASISFFCGLPPWRVWRFFQPAVAWLSAVLWLKFATSCA